MCVCPHRFRQFKIETFFVQTSRRNLRKRAESKVVYLLVLKKRKKKTSQQNPTTNCKCPICLGHQTFHPRWSFFMLSSTWACFKHHYTLCRIWTCVSTHSRNDFRNHIPTFQHYVDFLAFQPRVRSNSNHQCPREFSTNIPTLPHPHPFKWNFDFKIRSPQTPSVSSFLFKCTILKVPISWRL